MSTVVAPTPSLPSRFGAGPAVVVAVIGLAIAAFALARCAPQFDSIRWLAVASLAFAVATFAATLWLFSKEHRRRMRRVGLAADGKALTGADGTAPTPVLSPWLAAASLGAVGVFIYATNAIDETVVAAPAPIGACGNLSLKMPKELRTSSALTVELDAPLKPDACGTIVRNATLAVDGTTQPDTVPVYRGDGGITVHRWIAGTRGAGRHEVEIISSGERGFAQTTIVPTPSPTPRPVKRTGKRSRSATARADASVATLNAPTDCRPPLLTVRPPSAARGAVVAAYLKIGCKSGKIFEPKLYVNGKPAGQPLAPILVKGERVYRWVFARQTVLDRVDIVAAEAGDVQSNPFKVREPMSLTNLQGGIGALAATLVALSGLLVGILQFFRGEKVVP